MELLLCVINQPEKLFEILEGFVEIGIKGATVLESRGMGSILSQDVPIFATFRDIFGKGSPYNYTIFSIVEGKEIIKDAIKVIEEALGDLSEKDTGMVAVIPITFFKGSSIEDNLSYEGNSL